LGKAKEGREEKCTRRRYSGSQKDRYSGQSRQKVRSSEENSFHAEGWCAEYEDSTCYGNAGNCRLVAFGLRPFWKRALAIMRSLRMSAAQLRPWKPPNLVMPDVQRARFGRCKWTRPQAQIVSNTGTSVHPYFEIEYRTQGGTVFS